MAVRFHLVVFVGSLVGCSGSAPVAPVSSPTHALPVAKETVPTPSPSAASEATRAPVSASAEPTTPDKPVTLVAEPLALPGAAPPVSLDYLFYEPEKARIWVPAGGTGSVDVFDVAAHSFSRIEGFKTAEREGHGKKRIVGPSSGSVGDGVAYVGNRATDEVCAVDVQTLKLNACLKLPSAPDGVEYVAATREVWVTTPRTQSLTVLDAAKPSSLKLKSSIKLDGEPEGYAVDQARGLFLTNLEDKGSTLAIDLKSHALKDTWHPGCGSDGPRGIALDAARGLAFIACTDHVQALDVAHGGALLGRLDTGGGLDNPDFVAKTGLLYAASGKAARLSVARVGDHGELTLVASGETAPGARNVVGDEHGAAYVADSQGARLLLLRAPAH